MVDVVSVVKRRRVPLIALAATVLVYALVGFFGVPWVAERRVVRYFADTLGLEARVEEIHVNPFALSVRATAFAVREPGGADLLGFDELYVNFQLSSLPRWAWTFGEIRLTGPRVAAVLREDGSLNLADLVPPGPDAGSAPEDDAGAATLPRVLVFSFRLEDGGATFEDRTRPTPFRTAIGPASFTLERFGTMPDRDGALALETALESGGRFSWTGTLGVAPIRSEGRFELVDGHAPIAKKYLQDLLPVRIPDGRVDLGGAYEAAYDAGVARFALHDGTLAVRDFVVETEPGGAGTATEMLRVPSVLVSGIEVAWPERRAAAEDLAIEGARVAVWREPDGAIEPLRTLAAAGGETDVATGGNAGLADAPGDGAPVAGASADPDADAWHLALGRLAIGDLAVGIEDRIVDPPFRTGLAATRLEARGIDNVPGTRFAVTFGTDIETGGSVSVEGTAGALPQPSADLEVAVEALSLVPLQAYLERLARLRIDSGSVSLAGRLTSDADEALRYRGGFALEDLACHDVKRDELLAAVGRMASDDLLLETTAARLRISSLRLEHPYGRLTIYEDGTTNVGDVLGASGGEPAPGEGGAVPGATTASPSAPSSPPPLAIAIGALAVSEGSADFADLSLPLPFASRIESLDGSISEISSSGSSARVELEGTVDEYGLARVEGSLDAFAPDRRSDVLVAFRNVEMKGLSPYSAKFAGYVVDEGRLSLDLRYRIENRALDSDNRILVERLTLGEKVESSDAPNLPVKLAVALLKDKDGRIELDLPVSGTLDDPEFAYGKLVWKAVKNVLTKIATAPFRALARLAGAGEEDLEHIEFAPASAEIAGPARERLETLAGALAGRDELTLEVPGVYDPEVDAAEIRERKLEAEIAARVAERPEGVAGSGSEPALASELRRAALETLFVERFGEAELAAVVERNRAASSEAPTVGAEANGGASVDGAGAAAPETDLAAYLADLRGRLVALQPVSDEELGALADARAAAIVAFVVETGGIPERRVATLPAEAVAKRDAGGNWVRLELALSAP